MVRFEIARAECTSTMLRVPPVALAAFLVACLDRPVATQSPIVTAHVVDIVNASAISKIDLLFVIDNSSSMGDKQAFLAQAVPDLLKRLADPECVDISNAAAPAVAADPNTRACPPPTRRKFEPIEDIHVGIVTSSLGGHGAMRGQPPMPVCPESDNPSSSANQNDKAHLVARSDDQPIAALAGRGFLSWTPRESANAGDADRLHATFRAMVAGVGERGCGYEATLEAAYRFLNDPAPYDSLSVENGKLVQKGVDAALLRQRREFLRPDSLVVVVTISDENDYSVADQGPGFLALTPHGLLRGTSACDRNVNDRCCFNCQVATGPAGCPSPKEDPACSPEHRVIPAAEDLDNLRLTRSKLQYGIDLTYPIARYIEGFTKPMLVSGAQNPLFVRCSEDAKEPCAPERDPSLVFWAGIVGVPWQDIAQNPADLREGYQDASELASRGTWGVILGDPEASPPVAPRDRHMIVSPDPRAGLAGPASAAGADPIHGHEWLTDQRNLQYACTFALPDGPAKPCVANDQNCECFDAETTKNPLCQDPSTGAYGPRQFRAKAYPAVRALQVLQGLGAQGIVASICPANTSDRDRADYGYRPAIGAIAERLEITLSGRCLPRALEIAGDQSVPCVVLEAYTPSEEETCDCGRTPGRSPVPREVLTDEVNALAPCICALDQLAGESRSRCQRGESLREGASGWCYIDPVQSGDPEQCALVSKCAPTERRIIRYAGLAPRGRRVIMCQEKTAPVDRPDICAVR